MNDAEDGVNQRLIPIDNFRILNTVDCPNYTIVRIIHFILSCIHFIDVSDVQMFHCIEIYPRRSVIYNVLFIICFYINYFDKTSPTMFRQFTRFLVDRLHRILGQIAVLDGQNLILWISHLNKLQTWEYYCYRMFGVLYFNSASTLLENCSD